MSHWIGPVMSFSCHQICPQRIKLVALIIIEGVDDKWKTNVMCITLKDQNVFLLYKIHVEYFHLQLAKNAVVVLKIDWY